MNEITSFAEDLINFMKEYDYYDYIDSVESEEIAIEEIENYISNKNIDCIKNYLNLINNECEDIEESKECYSLLSRLYKLTYSNNKDIKDIKIQNNTSTSNELFELWSFMHDKKISNKQAVDIINTRTNKGCFWLIEKGKFIGIDNCTGDAWVEEFNTLQKCKAWLNGEFEISDI